MKKKLILFIILCVSFVSLCGNAYAEDHDFILGDKLLNEENSIVTDGNDGRAIWDYKTKTLVLENFDYDGEGLELKDAIPGLESFYTLFGTTDPGEVKVIVKGNNTFKYADNTFKEDNIIEIVSFFAGDVIFEGTGTLNIITSNDDNVLFNIGLYTLKSLNLYDAILKIETFKNQFEGVGLHSDLELNSYDASMIIKVHGTERDYALTTHALKLVNSYLDLQLNGGNDLFGIEANSASVSGSIIKIKTESAKGASSAIDSEEELSLLDSKINISTEGTGIVTDLLSANNTSMEISAGNGILVTGADVDLSKYIKDEIAISLNSTIDKNPSSWDTYKEGTNLSEFKYLNTSIKTSNGNKTYNLKNGNIRILTSDISNVLTLSEVNNLNIGYKLDALFNINVSDDYNWYDEYLINNNLNGYSLAKIVDISLTKQIGVNGREVKVANLTDKIKLAYKLDESLIGNKTYKVLRVHNGKVELLDAIFNPTTQELEFETDCFSTYAILYKNAEEIDNPHTADNIISYIFIGGLSLIGLAGCTIYINKKRTN